MSITAGYSEIATTVAQLKEVPAANRCPNLCLFVPAIERWVYYNPTSTATANDTTIFAPNDGIGRWIVTNQATAPTGGSSGITTQPGIQPAAATLTDLQRAVNQIASTLFSAGVTLTNLIRNYNAASPTNDLINLLGTNDGAVAFTNPHPGKITNSASSVGSGSVAALTDKAAGDFFTNNAVNSWIQANFSANLSRTVKLTGVGIQNRPDGASSPVSLTIEGSNDGVNFSSIFTWSAIGFSGGNQWRYVTFAESLSYSHIRIRQPSLNSSSSNFLGITEVNFYGSVSAL